MARPAPARSLREALALAYAHHAAGRYQEAEAVGRDVVARDPDNAHALHLVGEVALRRGDAATAIDLVERAIQSDPRFAEAHNTLGAAYKAAGRSDLALRAYRAAIRLRPGLADAHSNLGDALLALGQADEAVAALRQALALDASHANALNNLGAALTGLDRLDEAVAALERATALRPGFAAAYTNLGNVLRAQGRADRAAAAHARAVALAPVRADHHVNLGNSLRERGDLPGAIAALRRAVALSPDHVAAHNNLGAALLMSEAWAEGWTEFEWRWRLGENPALRARYSFPFWNGEDLVGRSILIWGEQGVGDVVLCGTMLSDLLGAGARVTLELDSRLVPLFARSFPEIVVVPLGAVPEASRFDAQANIARLGLFLRTRSEQFAASRPYLVPDPARVARFRDRYRALGAGPRIGIAWRSTSPSYKRKSLELGDFAPLFAALPQATFVTLQYGDTAAERGRAATGLGVRIVHDDTFDNWSDLDGLAAQIAALDHVVTVSNLNAHLAGALGIPAHVLLTQNSLWYWPAGKSGTAWYRSLSLLRTSEAPSAAAAVGRAAAAIRGEPA